MSTGQIAPGPEAGQEDLKDSIPSTPTAPPPYHMGESLNKEFAMGAAAGSAWGQTQS